MFPWITALQSARSVIRANFPSRVVQRVHFANDASAFLDQKRIPERMVTRDRTTVYPVEVGISYMDSEAYKITYGNEPIWKIYQRNHKGQYPPRQTRKTCIRNRMITTSNPCPVCRDEYLIVDYRNIKLLKQFISEHSGDILDTALTNVCRRKHKLITIAILKAKDHGLIPFDLPVRMYNYAEWYVPQKKELYD